MPNIKLTIQYDGTTFAGWQMQKNAKTVQSVLQEKIEMLLNEKINLIGSGRTDTGVHALGQVANFNTEKNLDLKRFVHSLNAVLPRSISVTQFEEVNEKFHSRFDAKKRSYIYLFSIVKSPFYNKFSWLNPSLKKYDLKRLNEISLHLKGKNDFTSFAKTKSETKNKVCEIYSIHWRGNGNLIIFYIEANRFLHGMVRTIIGTLLDAYEQKYPVEFLNNILHAKNRTEAGPSVKSKGLFLFKVKY